MTKFKITATVPVGQYANIMPEIEVDAPTFDEARAIAMKKLEEIWEQYGVVPLRKRANKGIELECFTGGSIWFNKETHTYSNDKGEKYLSGSVFAHQDEKPFDSVTVSEAYAKKNGGEAQYYRDQWQLNSDCSSGFGTAIHAALELYGTYGVVHKHPFLKSVVESFYAAHKDEKAMYEAVIANHELKTCGTVDRLLIVDEKKRICRVQDFKTDGVLTLDKKAIYTKQLNFYKEIMTAAWWTVEGLDLFHWDGEWHTVTL